MKRLSTLFLTLAVTVQVGWTAEHDTNFLRDVQAMCSDEAAVDRLLRDHPRVSRWFKTIGRTLCAEAGQPDDAPTDETPNRWDRLASPMTIERLEMIMQQPEPTLFTGGAYTRECWIDDFRGTDSLCTTLRLKLDRLDMPMSMQAYTRLKNYCAGKYPDPDLQRPCITDWIEKRWIMDGIREVPRAQVAGRTFDDYVEEARLTAPYKSSPVRPVSPPAVASVTSPRPAVAAPRPAPPPRPPAVAKPAPTQQTAGSRQKGHFGAIALSHSNTSFRFGFVTNEVSADAAKRAAITQCGENCSVPPEHGVFTKCGAIVFGRQPTARGRYVHWHTADSKASAESVINECRWNKNVTCTVDASGCN